MSFKNIKKYPSVEDILEKFPLPAGLAEVKKKRDAEIADIFTGEDDRIILVIGPCSAHEEAPVVEYAVRLARLQEQVRDRILFIPRVYTNKPRTTGLGYKGMLHQPDHKQKPDMARGLAAIRKMHIKVFSESHLPAADEMLYPDNYGYLADVLSYVAVGARSVENQQHRLTISGLDVPAGMKNPTSGDFNVMLDSVFAAQNAHTFVHNGWEVSTTGNVLAHAVIRGAYDRNGVHIPNYHYEDLSHLVQLFKKRGLKNPAIMIDTNHSNSGKRYKEQPRIAMEVLRSCTHSRAVREMFRGFMIESYLLEGSQDADGSEFGKSITDPCLGWEDTEKLVYQIAEYSV